VHYVTGGPFGTYSPNANWEMSNCHLILRLDPNIVRSIPRTANLLISATELWTEGRLLTPDIRNGVAEACTLLPGPSLPALPLSQKSGAVASAEHSGEAAELLEDP
jgi:hypothetical protein